jgi:hypothetical protein
MELYAQLLFKPQSIFKNKISFEKILPSCFPKWFYHFASLPSMYEYFICSISSPASQLIDMISWLYFSHINRNIISDLKSFHLSLLHIYCFYIILHFSYFWSLTGLKNILWIWAFYQIGNLKLVLRSAVYLFIFCL